MTWTTATLVAIDPRDTLVIYTVVFGRDDGPDDKQQFTARVGQDQISAAWLSQKVTDYINQLNGVNAGKIALGPIQLQTTPPPPAIDPARVAYFAALFAFQALNIPGGMGLVAAAQKERDNLKAALESGYKPEYFGQ